MADPKRKWLDRVQEILQHGDCSLDPTEVIAIAEALHDYTFSPCMQQFQSITGAQLNLIKNLGEHQK